MVSSARARSFVGTTRFEIRRQLGTGGTGVVYEAFDRERNARVALKTLVSVSPDALARFKNEFRSLQDLAHPNLVRLDELMEADGTWFFTMELVDGVDFLSHVRPLLDQHRADPASLERAAQREPRARTEISDEVDHPDDDEDDTVVTDGAQARARAPSPPLPGVAGFDERRLREALRQLVVGVAALHSAHKVHRDIKPGNVLVTADGRVVILDFGLITDPGRLEARAVGTANYMAPEQAAAQVVGPAADWYAVGVTLFRALTGGLPFAGSTAEIMQQKVDVEAPAPSDGTPGIPPDLDALCRQLLRREPGERPSARAILEQLGAASPPATVALPPAAAFVGRGRELATLAGTMSEVVLGGAVSVLVHGESGVGKSALVRQFVSELAASSSPPLLLMSRCYERESLPFKALDQAMDALARWLLEQPRPAVEALLPPRVALLADVVPSFAPVAALAGGGERITDPTQARTYAFAALRELLGRIARERPVVLVIDDLQWADGDSLALLTTLTAAPTAPAILLCATVRVAADADAVLARLGEHLGGDVRRVRVEGLPQSDARELATRLLLASSGSTGSSSVRPADIAWEAGGHPMFIDALVRHRLAHPTSSGPLRLDDALRARTDAVGRADRAVLAHVCIAGGPIGQEVCAHAAGIPFDELLQSITTLRAANLVRTHGIRRGDAVEPYHDRVREAVVAALDAAERKDIHGRLARALEASGQVDPERLAVHHAESGDHRRAARYAARAADRAAASLAFDRAATLYRRALELDPTTQQRLHVRLAEVLGQLGRGRESAESYLTAASLEEPGRALELQRLAAEQHLRSGHVNEALRTFESVLATVGMALPATRPRALASFVYQRARLRLRGLAFTPRPESAASPDLVRRIEVCASLYPMGLIDTLRGHPFQMRYLRFALDAGAPARIVRAIPPHLVFVSTLGAAGKGDAERLEALARRLAAQLREPYLDGVVETGSGASAFLFGRWAASRQACDRAEAALRERCTGAAWELDAAQLYGLRSLFFLGEIAEIRRRLPGALTEARDRGDLYLSTFLRTGLPIAMAYLAVDDAATARRHARQAMEEWSYQEVGLTHVHQLWGEVLLDLHDGAAADAERRMAETWPRLEQAMYLRIQLTRLVTLHLRASIAVARGAGLAGSERERRLTAASADARRMRAAGTPWATPLATLIDAGVAAVRGDSGTAARCLEEAELGLGRADMALHAAAARLQRGRLIGASEGESLVTAARAWMGLQDIRRPERIAAALVPGFSA